MKNLEDGEEGEVRIYDNEAYIFSDGELFSYKTFDNVHVNWRSIREFDDSWGFGTVNERVNMLQSVDGQRDISSYVLQNID
jgi:hypothetical protein